MSNEFVDAGLLPGPRSGLVLDGYSHIGGRTIITVAYIIEPSYASFFGAFTQDGATNSDQAVDEVFSNSAI